MTGAGGAVPRILAKRSSAVSYLADSGAAGAGADARTATGSGGGAEAGVATWGAGKWGAEKEKGTEAEA